MDQQDSLNKICKCKTAFSKKGGVKRTGSEKAIDNGKVYRTIFSCKTYFVLADEIAEKNHKGQLKNNLDHKKVAILNLENKFRY